MDRDPLDFAGCEELCVPETRVVQNTDDASILKSYGGIEMALWICGVRSGTSRSTKCWEARSERRSPSPEYFAFRPASGVHGRDNAQGGRGILRTNARGVWSDLF